MELSFSIQHTIEEPLKFNRDLINFDMCLDIKKFKSLSHFILGIICIELHGGLSIFQI